MRRALLPCLLFALACRNEKDPAEDSVPTDSLPGEIDEDADGVPSSQDCDDSDASVSPEAEELCDGIDNDCDGEIDEDATDASTFYADSDGDGYGSEDDAVDACEAPSGYAEEAGDCDDSDADYHPGATEDDCADPNDYNCDGSVGYADSDGDGYAACEECDDADADAYPDAEEVCDEVDNDCDGETDEEVTSTYWQDVDGDGSGDADYPTEACAEPEGYADNDDDCDDSDASVNPYTAELCDGIDNDCDGATDEDDAADAETWYADADGDSYGDPDASAEACDQPSGYADNDEDCDDTDASLNPETTWYLDYDGDGFGGSVTLASCEQPSGYLADSSDCDDAEAEVNPDAEEVCNGVDDDCDGDIDAEDSDGPGDTIYYADADGDGFGDADSATTGCEAPSGYVEDAADCDDGESAVNPDAEEVCNGLDDDCDGDVDDADSDVTGDTTFYEDADGDGYGLDDSATLACEQPSGYAEEGGDCDDEHAEAYPGGTEVRDGLDNDCDGAGYDGDYSVGTDTLAGGEYEYTSFAFSGSLTVSGSDPLEIWVLEDATLGGPIYMGGEDGDDHGPFTSSGNDGGAGGGGGGGDGGDGGCYYCGVDTGEAGGGDAGGSGGTRDYAGSGGGGGGNDGAGEDGGEAVCTSSRCGSDYTIAGGAGGADLSSSTPVLQPGSGGAGGGVGGGDNGDGGGGGGGGGALFLSAEDITLHGTIDCSGGDGGSDSSGYDGGSGGGGSGGTVRIVADSLTVLSGGGIDCTGGSGGTTVIGGTTAQGGFGGDGADGQIWLDVGTLSDSGSITPSYKEP